MTYLVLLWLCHCQMWEAWLTGRPAGRPGATSCTLRTPKSSWHGSCAGRSDACPPGDNNKVKATLMPGAAEQILEMRSRAWNMKVTEMPSKWSLTQALWCQTAYQHRGASGLLPIPATIWAYIWGTAGRGFCYSILFAFFFSFCLSFQRCGLTAVTGVNRHWHLPCGQDIILLSLARCRSSGHKIIRALPCQRCKERQPPNSGERHQLRWQTLHCNHSQPENKIMS